MKYLALIPNAWATSHRPDVAIFRAALHLSHGPGFEEYIVYTVPDGIDVYVDDMGAIRAQTADGSKYPDDKEVKSWRQETGRFRFEASTLDEGDDRCEFPERFTLEVWADDLVSEE